MCGIAGILDAALEPRVLRAALARMQQAMVHRGPDEGGMVVLPGEQGGLAVRRLSIVDLESGSQPLANEDGTVHAVVNGEIYNHRVLRDELNSQGHRFRSSTDAEVVVHLYEEHGTGCLDRLHGMFGLAVFDSRNRRLLLARDGPGMKPLYFARTGSGFLFASEVKALFASGLVKPDPHPAAMDAFLDLGYIPTPLSAYRNVEKLCGGQYLVLEPVGMRRGAFWEYRYNNDGPPVSDAEYVEELELLLSNAVRSHLAADVSVGSVLSGGWDSSLVTTFAARCAGTCLKTYSVVFPEDPLEDESRFSRSVAEHLGTDHYEIEYRSSMLPQLLPTVVRHLEEPCALPGSVVFLLSSLAAQHEKTVVSGDGADELFAGYGWLLPKYPHLVRKLVPKAPFRYAASRAMHPRLVRSLGFLGAEDERMADIQWLRTLSPVHKHQLVKPEYHVHAPETGLVSPQLVASCQDALQRRLGSEFTGRLQDGILFMTDKMSMAHSLEVRMPFLDRSVVDFALRLPSRLKTDRNRPKIILSELARRHLPAEVAARAKKPFRVPVRDWTRPPMEKYAREILLDNARDGPFDATYLERNLPAWLRSGTKYWTHVARLLILQIWWNTFVGATEFPEKPSRN
jgi:asparagine synthase (glutamine-hydrolysing)